MYRRSNQSRRQDRPGVDRNENFKSTFFSKKITKTSFNSRFQRLFDFFKVIVVQLKLVCGPELENPYASRHSRVYD
jgi:hypothetical protein